jgi:hypothetical protein
VRLEQRQILFAPRRPAFNARFDAAPHHSGTKPRIVEVINSGLDRFADLRNMLSSALDNESRLMLCAAHSSMSAVEGIPHTFSVSVRTKRFVQPPAKAIRDPPRTRLFLFIWKHLPEGIIGRDCHTFHNLRTRQVGKWFQRVVGKLHIDCRFV